MKRLLISLSLGFVGLFLIPVGVVSATESPWGILLNNDQSKCADLWNGEDYAKYAYEDGWDIYYPQPNTDGVFQIIVDEDTLCYYNDGNEACCQALGYTFMEDTNEVVREAPELYVEDTQDQNTEDNAVESDSVETMDEDISVLEFIQNNIYLVIVVVIVAIGGVIVAIFAMKGKEDNKDNQTNTSK